MDLDEVKRATVLDKTLKKVIEYMCTGKWYNLKHLEDADVDLLELQIIRNDQDELAVYSDTVLLRDGRLVLPKSLRYRAVAIAHESHPEIRSKVMSKISIKQIILGSNSTSRKWGFLSRMYQGHR